MNRLSTYNLLRSFGYAFSGVARSLWRERNLRIHFFAAAYVLYFSKYFDLSKSEYAILLIAIGLVVACEMINTAIEAAVDLNTTEYHKLARNSKDAAAGAVLVAAAISVAVGYILFWQPTVLLRIWSDILSAPFVWLFLLAISVFLIAWPEYKQTSGKNNNPKDNS